jgi:hypothetical protein
MGWQLATHAESSSVLSWVHSSCYYLAASSALQLMPLQEAAKQTLNMKSTLLMQCQSTRYLPHQRQQHTVLIQHQNAAHAVRSMHPPSSQWTSHCAVGMQLLLLGSSQRCLLLLLHCHLLLLCRLFQIAVLSS